MQIISHRRNSLDALRSTPEHLGVEMDVRLRHGQLVVAHDPFEDGPDLDVWLDAYRHALLVVNVKEEGLEPHLLPRLARRGIERFFLLDQTFPTLMRTLRGGERRVAVRVSDLEGVETALRLAGRAAWVWLDGFERFPCSGEQISALRAAGYRLCLVSPELHGRDRSEVGPWRQRAHDTGAWGDAVCTRELSMWG